MKRLLAIALLVVGCASQSDVSQLPSGDLNSNTPPVGEIWFGTGLDTATRTMPSHVASAPVETTGLSFLATLTRLIKNESVTLYAARNGGQTLPLGTQNSGASASNLFAGPVPELVMLVSGTFLFTVKDAGGNTLATGILELTE
jgi:hypothetical protein